MLAKHIKPPERQPYPAHAEKWIEIARLRQASDRLVAAGIEGTDGYWLAGSPFDHLPVGLVLFVLVWQLCAALKQKFGSHQANAVDVSGVEIAEFGKPGHIDHDLNLFAACRQRRPTEGGRRLAGCHLLGQSSFVVGAQRWIGIDDERAGLSVEHGVDPSCEVVDIHADNHRHAARPGENGDMT